MEIAHLISIGLATVAGASAVGKAWSTLNSRQSAMNVKIENIKEDMGNIPGNDPELFRSVADCREQKMDCDATKNMHLLQQTVAELMNDHAEDRKNTIKHQRFIEGEIRKIVTSVAKLETQIDERTQKGGTPYNGIDRRQS